jgi:hypothetical protein
VVRSKAGGKRGDEKARMCEKVAYRFRKVHKDDEGVEKDVMKGNRRKERCQVYLSTCI